MGSRSRDKRDYQRDLRSTAPPPAVGSAPARSVIKPQLFNLSTSGTLLTGAVVERNRELGCQGIDSTAVKAARHLIVVHEGAPARLDWRHEGVARSETFAGDVILNPLGLFIAPRWWTDVELLLLAIEPSLVSRVAEEMGRHPVELIPRIRSGDEVLRALSRQLAAEFERDTPADRVYAQSLVYALVAHLIRHHSVSGLRPGGGIRSGLPPASLARVLDFIEAHLGDPLTLERLAGVAGFSPSHFTSLFRRATGLAPHQFLMERRVERARVLLSGTRLPISEVAVLAGFADQSHLTRTFKRLAGVTPRLVRAR